MSPKNRRIAACQRRGFDYGSGRERAYLFRALQIAADRRAMGDAQGARLWQGVARDDRAAAIRAGFRLP